MFTYKYPAFLYKIEELIQVCYYVRFPLWTMIIPTNETEFRVMLHHTQDGQRSTSLICYPSVSIPFVFTWIYIIHILDQVHQVSTTQNPHQSLYLYAVIVQLVCQGLVSMPPKQT